MTNTKLLTAAGALILLATGIMPNALSHDDFWLCPNPTPSPNPPIPFPAKAACGGSPGSAGHRYPTMVGSVTIPHVETGVAGTYVGSYGPAVAFDAYAFPNNALAIGNLLCDSEVGRDENLADENEQVVDGSPTAGNHPDGNWDDGGIGGACHTNHYTTAKFNTPGCPGGRRVAGGNVLSEDIFVAAVCDYHEVGSVLPEERFALCLVNGALAFNPLGNPIIELGNLAACGQDYVRCLFTPTCQATEGEICGADGTADAIDFGYGQHTAGAVANFPTVGIVSGPPVVVCQPADATEWILVFDTVATFGGTYVDPDGNGRLDPVYTPNSTTTVDVYPALTGQLWTVTP